MNGYNLLQPFKKHDDCPKGQGDNVCISRQRVTVRGVFA